MTNHPCVSVRSSMRHWMLTAGVTALAAGQAQAQTSTDASETPFEEIIVSAEKREESLQSLSQAVTALTAASLDKLSVRSFEDLSALAPGLTIANNEGFRTVIAIRGVGNEGNQNDVVNPSVSYHLDGVYIASPFSLQTDFIDVAQIEVLRGPQGTLFGQNSTGGAINVITQDPDFDALSWVGDIAYGSFDFIGVRSSVNVPISETLALRASVGYRGQDGTATNISNGQDLDDSNNLSWRLKLLWEPTPDFRLKLFGQRFSEETNGPAQFGLIDPTPLEDASGRRQLAQDSAQGYDLVSEVYSLTAEYDFSGVTAKFLASYQLDDIETFRDNDRSDINVVPPFAIVPSLLEAQDQRQETYTAEFNLVSAEPAFGKLDWIIGGFYLDQSIDLLFFERLDFNFDGIFAPIDPADPFGGAGEIGFQSDAFPNRESISVYGQATYNLSDSVRLIGGLRYTDDEVTSEVFNFFALPNGLPGVDLEQSSSELTGRAAIEFDLSDDQLLFASYTRGFKPGGSNLTFGRESEIAPIIVLPTYEQETIDAFELGLKGDYFGGLLRANLAGFFYFYDNIQFQATDPEVFQGGVGNIPQSEIYGIEGEFIASLAPGLTLDVKAAYIETEITESFLALDNVASDAATNALIAQGFNLFGPEIQIARSQAVTDVEGNDLAKTPNFNLSTNLQYVYEWADLSTATLSFQWVHRGSFQQRIFNNPLTDNVPSYNLINAYVGYDHGSGRWGVEASATNLGDTNGINARFTDVFGVGATADQLIAPRQYIVRFKWRL